MTATGLEFENFRQAYPKARVYVFDVDHTLTSRSTGIRYAWEGLRRGFVRKRTILSFPFRYLNYRLGRYGVDDIPAEFKDLRGRSRAELDDCARDVFDQWIKADVFPKAEAFFRAAKAAGIRVVLSSSSFDFILEPLSRWLGADALYATRLSFDAQGTCTGEIAGTANYSKGKIDSALQEAAKQGVGPEAVAFFSDSVNDLPLLERVGVPVPTNADRKLTKASQAHGWPIYTFET